jgi:hypothetical protein
LSGESEEETGNFIKVRAFYTDWRDEGIPQTTAALMMGHRQPGKWLGKGGAIQRQSIWYAGLSGLARSSNHTHETDRRNQMNQFPATRREIERT